MAKKILTNAIAILGLLLIVGNAYSDEVSTSGHKWKIGEKWQVRTWSAVGGLYGDAQRKSVLIQKGKERIADFEVIGIKSTADFNVPYTPTSLQEREKGKYKNMPKEGYKCYEVAVTFPVSGMGFQERYLLYYRTDTGSLIRVLDNSIRQDGLVINFPTDYPIDPNGPVLTDNIPCGIPFDWPDFAVTGSEEKVPQDREGKELKIINQQIIQKQLKDYEGKEYVENEIVMSKKAIIKKEDGTEEIRREIKAVQKWRAGEPWWREAKVYEDGKIIREAELIVEQQ